MAGLTPMKAIRAKCLDCCCGQANEVRLCTATQCPLYEYRSGHNPALKGKRKNNLHDAKKPLITSDFSEKSEEADKYINEEVLF